MSTQEDKKSRSCLVLAIVWIVILGILALAAKWLVMPYFQEQLTGETGSKERYKHTVSIAMDAFSGYAPLRSALVRDLLRKDGIGLKFVDDKADYPARMEMLKNRQVDMAVFTVDSFVLAGAQHGAWPGTIVMVLDESDGADAIVSHGAGVASLEDLNSADGRFVLTPDSPSEFLARTVISHFDLEGMPGAWREKADGANDVLTRFQNADPKAPRAYVLWEPYVSKALETPGATLLLDSAKLRGYIIDILVVERSFLKKHPEQVKAVMRATLSATYHYSQHRSELTDMVREDARSFGGEAIDQQQAQALCAGVAWKGTLENFAYFGLLDTNQMRGGKHVEDVILDVTDVLVRTGALAQDPLAGRGHTLFYDGLLRELRDAGFHPGKALDPLAANTPLEAMATKSGTRALSEAEWSRLRAVGAIRIPPISFGRGTSRIHAGSQRSLARIAHTLEAWPGYYLRITGHASRRGDPEANRILAQQRADAVKSALVQLGVPAGRLQALAPSDRLFQGRAVSFHLLQEP